MKKILSAFAFAASIGLAATAGAGTTTIDFTTGVGNLTEQASGVGTLTSSNGRAVVSGPTITLMEDNNSRVVASGTTSITMGLQPNIDAVNGVGLILVNPADGEQVTVTVSDDGSVDIFSSASFGTASAAFPFPAASNNSMTLTFNAATEQLTLSIAGSQSSAQLSSVFLGGVVGGVWLGILAGGPAGFESFSATGPSIPDLDATGGQETTITFPLNGAQEVPAVNTLATGCGVATLNSEQTELTVEVEHGVYDAQDAHIHIGAAGVDGGVVFPFASVTSPMTETFPLTPTQAADFLAGNYYVNIHTGAHPGGEIRGQMVDDPNPCSVAVDPGPIDSDGDGVLDQDDAFPLNPFGATDDDNDGIGDEWELAYFPDISVADETSDSDGDGISDFDEWKYAVLGLNPTAPSELPAAGAAGLVLLTLVFGYRVARRK